MHPPKGIAWTTLEIGSACSPTTPSSGRATGPADGAVECRYGCRMDPSTVVSVCKLAVHFLRIIKQLKRSDGSFVQLRVGVATGPAVMGVLGYKKPLVGQFGDSVSMASRMESTGIPATVQICSETFAEPLNAYDSADCLAEDLRCAVFRWEKVLVKGKGVSRPTCWYLQTTARSFIGCT